MLETDDSTTKLAICGRHRNTSTRKSPTVAGPAGRPTAWSLRLAAVRYLTVDGRTDGRSVCRSTVKIVRGSFVEQAIQLLAVVAAFVWRRTPGRYCRPLQMTLTVGVTGRHVTLRQLLVARGCRISLKKLNDEKKETSSGLSDGLR